MARLTSTPTGRAVMTVPRAVMLVLAAVLALIASASPASAHALLTSSSPADGASLSHCPRKVSLAFDEAVAAGGVTVTINRKKVPVSATTPDNQHFSVVVVDCTNPSVTVDWTTVSADDGHVATGALHFQVGGKPSPAAARGGSSSGAASSTLLAASRALGYLCLALFGGGLLFVSLLWPAGASLRRIRFLITCVTGLGILSAIGALWSTVHMTGMTMGAALRLPFGREYAALALLWVLVAVVVVDFLQRGEVATTRLSWRVSGLMLFLAIASVESMSAHAYASSHPTLGLAVDMVHVSAMSVWIGGLMVITTSVLPILRGEELASVVQSFSRWARLAVSAVVATGVGLLFLVVVPLPTFWGTHYANVLSLKVALLCAALLAAAGSHRWVTRSRTRSAAASVARIATTVGIETLCALAVLAAAGTLVTSSPGV